MNKNLWGHVGSLLVIWQSRQNNCTFWLPFIFTCVLLSFYSTERVGLQEHQNATQKILTCSCWHRRKWYIVNSMHTVIVFWSLWLQRKARECHGYLGSLQPYIVFCRLTTYLGYFSLLLLYSYCFLNGQFLGGECGGSGLETFLCHKTLA